MGVKQRTIKTWHTIGESAAPLQSGGRESAEWGLVTNNQYDNNKIEKYQLQQKYKILTVTRGFNKFTYGMPRFDCSLLNAHRQIIFDVYLGGEKVQQYINSTETRQ
jgi:hypothetical protein